MKCWLCPRSSQKRESGESPERSGHCNRGANLHYPIVHSMRRGRQAMILKSGNLLCMARLNFRVKCNNHFRDSAPLGRCLLFYESRHFFMECACSYELYMIKWQAILLRIHSFPPRTHERIIFLPRGGIATSFFIGKFMRGYVRRGEKSHGEAILGRQRILLLQPQKM